VAEIKLVTIKSGSGSIVEDGLIRNVDVEDRTHNKGGFSGRDSKRDVKGEDEAKNIRRVVDSGNIDQRFERLGVSKFFWFEVILAVKVIKFELRRTLFAENFFRGVKLVQCLDAMRTKIVAAFMEGNLGALFPDEECPVTVRAKETCLGFTEPLVNLKKMTADFAA
jgi:hypothetical protein